ncbi:MAG: NADH-quinone oxidoreductase subunit NuoF [Candidatus Micrarchaeota archaeon]
MAEKKMYPSQEEIGAPKGVSRCPVCSAGKPCVALVELVAGRALCHDDAACKEAKRARVIELFNPPKPVFYVGAGPCGLSAGAGEVRDALVAELKRRGSDCEVVATGCMGFCFAEPLVEVRAPGVEGVIYSEVKVSDVPSLVSSTLENKVYAQKAFARRGACAFKGGEKVPLLSSIPFYALQMRDAFENCGLIDPESLDHYLSRGGYAGLAKALCTAPQKVIEEVKRAGLRGRGGAGFLTGLKWELCRKEKADEKFMVCNADEGDPGAFMNRVNLEGDPHKVLEGLIIAAYAIGATEGFFYVRAEKPLAAARIKKAVEQARKNGLLGKNILGSSFSLDVGVRLGAGAFVCGEETALIASLEGKRGMPRARPPYPAQKGLWGKPTTINNVETLAHVPNILLKGAGWFASRGAEKSKGTKVFCMTGNVNNTGAFEVPVGITLRDMVFKIGGGIQGGKKFKAAQTGGPSGGCLPSSCLDLPLEYESLQKAGSIMGSGGLVVMDEGACMVDVAKYFLSFTQSESCGQCTPCREGTARMLDILVRITEGKGQEGDVERLERMGGIIKETSLCGLGQTAPNPVLSTIRYFRDEYDAHIREKRCPAGVCRMNASLENANVKRK